MDNKELIHELCRIADALEALVDKKFAINIENNNSN